VVVLFQEKGLLNPEFSRTLLSWRHSGFSIDSGTRIYDTEARQGLRQCIFRAPLAMQKLEWDEEQDAVTWNSSPTGYFQGKHLLCRYGLYASRARGTWKKRPALSSRAPVAGMGATQRGRTAIHG
jgi:hypothetical protein